MKATEGEDKELEKRTNNYLQSKEVDMYERILDPISDEDDTLAKQLFATVSQYLDDVRQERDERAPSIPLGHVSPRNREEVTPKR